MDQWLKDAARFGDLTGTFTLLDMTIVLLLSFALSMVIGWLYKHTHRAALYSQSYVQTLVIMGTTVALIMLIVGSNIARAFALVGALSIVRFRNAMKETRDIGFVFLVMGVGMAVGTRFYGLAVYATAMFCAFVMIMFRLNLFARGVTERLLVVQTPPQVDAEKELEEAFRARLDSWRLITIGSVRGGALQESTFSVLLRKGVRPAELVDAVRACPQVQKVNLVLGQQEVDL